MEIRANLAEYLHRKETVAGGSFQIPLPLPYHPIVIFKTKNKRNQNKSKEENNYQWSIVTTTDKTHTHAKVTYWGRGGGGGGTPLFALSGYVLLNSYSILYAKRNESESLNDEVFCLK